MTSTSALPAIAAIPAVAAVAPATAAFLRSLRHIGQQRHLACALHRRRHLHLVPAARAGDAAAADLPLFRDVAPQLGDVLVVDLRDVLLAEEAVTALDLPRRPARPPPLLLTLLSR